MKWSFKDMLLAVGIMVAAIILAAAVFFKEDLSAHSREVKSLLPKKVSLAPGLQKVKQLLSLLP